MYGLFAGGDCAAYAEECLGDCVGASMPDRMSSYQRWATCRVGPGRAESAGGDGGAASLLLPSRVSCADACACHC